MAKYEIVMVRHGESQWNQQNLFCGWFDADLSDNGVKEAAAAGKALKGKYLNLTPRRTWKVFTRKFQIMTLHNL
jgi:bisphosphoglycerate-dependent phosphoglycerate mutase